MNDNEKQVLPTQVLLEITYNQLLTKVVVVLVRKNEKLIIVMFHSSKSYFYHFLGRQKTKASRKLGKIN